jgi:hypothetical protein
MDKFLNKMKNPDKEFRPIPFWSWNDKLDPELLRWQVNEMSSAGLGGYFMHARAGLETEYLGKEWMKCIETCIEEGNKTGMHSWIYDENGWPSGFADGKVTALGDRVHGRWLKLEKLKKGMSVSKDESILGIYLHNLLENSAVCISAIDTIDIEENHAAYIIRNCSNPYYIDVMSKEAVRAFLDSTHEKYYSLFGEEFGKGMKGFFTDEPRLYGDFEGDIPWSYAIKDLFQKDYGYDIVEKLLGLFLPVEGYEKVRYDFWQLVSKLFSNSYAKQIGDWCREHNCMLTGHIMMEESLFSQMTGSGGVMPLYEYMQLPGIDWLRRMISTPIVPKQAGSVAAQLGKGRVITESYALCGWNVNFEELKWIAEWQYVNGVNLMCQHLEGYTLRGVRKRDYPPSLFIQQTWWKQYSEFNDYLARLGFLLSSGKAVVDTLVIHPIRSGWIAYDGSNNQDISILDKEFIVLSETLAGLHIDYHFGDEGLIRKYGSVSEGILKIGLCEYRTIILPSMITLDMNTMQVLIEFAEQGGTIFYSGNFPYLVNGEKSTRIDYLKNKAVSLAMDRNKIYDHLKNVITPSISICRNHSEIEAIRYQQRDIDGNMVFFIVNQDNAQAYNAEIKINVPGKLRRLYLENMQLEDVDYVLENSILKCNIEFAPMQSCILVVEKEAAQLAGGIKDNTSASTVENTTKYSADKSAAQVIKPGPEWVIEEMGLNTLTLDFCSYRINNGDWSNKTPVIKLLDVLLKLKKTCDISLKFEFEADLDLELNQEMYLVLEKADEFSILLNDVEIPYTDIGWWKDYSFKKVDIKGRVRKGKNTLILNRRFYQSPKVYDTLFGGDVYETELNKLTYDVELESIYILGDFGVVSKSEYINSERTAVMTEGPFVIVDRPAKLKSGDFTRQGLCFFAERLLVSQMITVGEEATASVFLDIGRPNAPMINLYLNDKFVKTILWAPFKTEVSQFLKTGDNKLTLEFFSSNRNLLGPHHHKDGECYSVGPDSFTGKWSWVEKKTEAIPSTEEERKADYWLDRYAFVEFGLK